MEIVGNPRHSKLLFKEWSIFKYSNEVNAASLKELEDKVGVGEELTSKVAMKVCRGIARINHMAQDRSVFRKVVSEKKAKATSNQAEPLVTQEWTKEMLTAFDTAVASHGTLAQVQAPESRWQREMMEHFNVRAFQFVVHVLHWSRGPADHAFNWASVPSIRSVAVDRQLPSRVPMWRGSSMTTTHYSRNLGSGSAHTTSLCQMLWIVRMTVARICAMPISEASLCEQFGSWRLARTPGSLLRSQSTP